MVRCFCVFCFNILSYFYIVSSSSSHDVHHHLNLLLFSHRFAGTISNIDHDANTVDVAFEDGDESNGLELEEVRFTPGGRPTTIGADSMRCNHLFDLIAVAPNMQLATVLLGAPSSASLENLENEANDEVEKEELVVQAAAAAAGEEEGEEQQQEEVLPPPPPSEIILMGAGSRNYGKLDANGTYKHVDWSGRKGNWPVYQNVKTGLEIWHGYADAFHGGPRLEIWTLGTQKPLSIWYVNVSSTAHEMATTPWVTGQEFGRPQFKRFIEYEVKPAPVPAPVGHTFQFEFVKSEFTLSPEQQARSKKQVAEQFAITTEGRENGTPLAAVDASLFIKGGTKMLNGHGGNMRIQDTYNRKIYYFFFDAHTHTSMFFLHQLCF